MAECKTPKKSYLEIVAEQIVDEARRREELNAITGLSVMQLVEINSCSADPAYLPETLSTISVNQIAQVARALGSRI